MMPRANDYAGAGFEFAMGAIYGLRVWRQDELGRLRARHIDVAPPWRPGVNRAACHAGQHGALGTWLNALYTSTSNPHPAVALHDPAAVPVEDCKCGFYAFTRDTADSYEVGNVLGVIRGSGRTLIGTKGFRCEYAEIVALVDPTCTEIAGMRDWSARQRDRLTVLYPQVPLLPDRRALLEFAPIEWTEPDPASEDFWSAP